MAAVAAARLLLLLLAACAASAVRDVPVNFDPIATMGVLGGEEKVPLTQEFARPDTRLGQRAGEVDAWLQPVNAARQGYSEPTSNPGNMLPNAAALQDDVPDPAHFAQFAARLFRDQGKMAVHAMAAAEMKAMAPGQTDQAVYLKSSDAPAALLEAEALADNVPQYSPNGQRLPLPGTRSQPGQPPLGATPAQTTPFEVATKPMVMGRSSAFEPHQAGGESSEHTCQIHWAEESKDESQHKCKKHKHKSDKADSIGETLLTIKIDPKTATAPSAQAMAALGGESSEGSKAEESTAEASEASGAAGESTHSSESAGAESSESAGGPKKSEASVAEAGAKTIDPNVEAAAKEKMKQLIAAAEGKTHTPAAVGGAAGAAAGAAAKAEHSESTLASNEVHVGDTDVKHLGADVTTTAVEAGGYRVITESGTKATRTTIQAVHKSSESSEESSKEDPAAEALRIAQKAARDAEAAAKAMDAAEHYMNEGLKYHHADVQALNPISSPTPHIGKTIVHTVVNHKKGETTTAIN